VRERSATFPRVTRTARTVVSPWVTLLEREVRLAPDAPPEVYHSLTQADYVSALAVTSNGLIPVIRQYRPAVEAYTWEFPAGTVDEGETPAQAMTREIVEETGLHTDALHEIGSYHPDTGRLSLASTAFFARCSGDGGGRPIEPGLEVRFVTLETLCGMVQSGEFRHQLHVALLASALLHGHITLPNRRYDGTPSQSPR